MNAATSPATALQGGPSLVTITGADNDVDVGALIDLSAEFPFVEWGILASASREGQARYPTCSWILTLIERWLAAKHEVRMSLHLCGGRARALRAGDTGDALDGLPGAYYLPFQRLQVNGFDPLVDQVEDLAAVCRQLPGGREIILQVGIEEHLAPAAEFVRRIPRGGASVLFDPSGGLGRRARRYPAPPARVRMGYAGGLGPRNIENELQRMLSAREGAADGVGFEPSFWLDMESGVRLGDRFDLRLVREVLTTLAPTVERR